MNVINSLSKARYIWKQFRGFIVHVWSVSVNIKIFYKTAFMNVAYQILKPSTVANPWGDVSQKHVALKRPCRIRRVQSWFFQWLPKIFFQRGPKVVKFSFALSKLGKQLFCCKKFHRKMSNFKIQQGTPLDAHVSKMIQMWDQQGIYRKIFIRNRFHVTRRIVSP